MDIYEEKRLNVKESESESYHREYPKLSVDEYLKKIRDYDIISFDVFDTLIFRPMAQPTDVFYLIGEQTGIMDFKNIRVWNEWDARVKCYDKYGHREINLGDIWKNLEKDVGFPAAEGIKLEQNTEKKLCFANPFMLELYKRLTELNKKIIIVSDMYLSKDCIVSILENAGYKGAHKVYISNEYHKNKYEGKLYEEVIKDLYGDNTLKGKRKNGEIGKDESIKGKSKNSEIKKDESLKGKLKKGNDLSHKDGKPGKNKNGFSIVHIGDNPRSDWKMARQHGLDILPYQNVNKNILLYRPMDMSYLVGGAYRGIVSSHLYNGLHTYTMEYEYGYLYGGLFVLGYCNFIHDYCRTNQVDKLMFLSRDGDILQKAYHELFSGEETSYVYWSRKASVKLMADYDKHDYFRRFIYHKINQKYTLKEILHSMELEFLADELGDWKDIWAEWMKELKNADKFIDLKADDELTNKNGYLLRRFIEAKWDKVLNVYASQQKAAGEYYKEILKDCRKAAAVDIGWAGSGALSLSYLVDKAWNIPCEVVGIIAGTNTVHNAEPDASEAFLQSGKLVSYLYSQSHNRDLLKKHAPNKDYNVFWELLLSSPTPQFVGFDLDENETVKLNFGKYDENQDGIKEIQKGILDFVRQYRDHFKDFPYMFRISGRDAYAPMLLAASHNEKYLKAIGKKFRLEINVN